VAYRVCCRSVRAEKPRGRRGTEKAVAGRMSGGERSKEVPCSGVDEASEYLVAAQHSAEASEGLAKVSEKSVQVRVDFHTHLLPHTWPDFSRRYGYNGFLHIQRDQIEVSAPGNAWLVRDGELYAEIGPNCWDLEKRMQDMDAVGIDVQVVSTIPEMFAYWAKREDAADLARIMNTAMAEQIKGKSRFIGLGTVPMQAPELAIKELTRCMEELNFAGVIVGTHINDWNLDASELVTFWEACEELGAIVFIHPNYADTKGGSDESLLLPRMVGLPAEICHSITCFLTGGIMDQFQNLKVCFANGAGAFPYLREQIAEDIKFSSREALLDAAARLTVQLYPGRFFVDSIVHSRNTLEFLLKALSDDVIVFGSDYPYPLGGVATKKPEDKYPIDPMVVYDFLEQETLLKIVSDNAQRCLEESLTKNSEISNEKDNED